MTPFHVHAPKGITNQPVQELDIVRYQGLWHEIAHLPMFYQRHCFSDITASYSVREDGCAVVRNACLTREGHPICSEGVAKPVPGRPGALKVRFAPDWLAWLPWIWADYWVIDLDPAYQWAVVGGPTRKYLWVLSRSPMMRRDHFERLRQRAGQRGYPVQGLVVVGCLVP
nr:lipocalin family protein [Dyella monticola]